MPTNQKAVIARMQKSMDAALEASQDEYIAALVKRYAEFEERLKADILRIHTEMFKGGTPNYSDFEAFSGDAIVQDAIKQELERLNQDVNESLHDELVRQYKSAYNRSSWVIDESTPMPVDIVYEMPIEPIVREMMAEPWEGAMFSQRIGVINDFMAQDIQQQVTQAMLSGDSVYDLGKRISGVIGTEEESYAYRSKMIAQAELLRASNRAINNSYDQNEDIIDDWYWMTRSLGSGRLCEECAERSGKSYKEVSEDIAPYQDKSDVDPPIHPWCACRWSARVKSWNDLVGKELAAMKNDETMGYDEWAKAYLTVSEE
jgi:hypothetical protein